MKKRQTRFGALIVSLHAAASELYEKAGYEMPVAAGRALDRYKIYDGFFRDLLFRDLCSRMGKNGNFVKAALKKKREKRKHLAEIQPKLPFSSPGKC